MVPSLPEAPQKRICSTYMKGPETSWKGVCSTYMKGRRALQPFKTHQKEFVPPIWRGAELSSPSKPFKRSVYSEIDDFNAFVVFPPFGGQKSSKSRSPQNRLSQKERLFWNWRLRTTCKSKVLQHGAWILMLLCVSHHLVARNPQNAIVPKTGFLKKDRLFWNWRF